MTSLVNAFRSEVRRLARKAVRAQSESLRKQNAVLRRQLSELKARVTQLTGARRRLLRLHRAVTVLVPDPQAQSRFSAKGLRSHRVRLGLSAEELGQLIGVSSQTVYNWEGGKSRPRAAQLSAIAALRAMGRREARAQIESRLNEPAR